MRVTDDWARTYAETGTTVPTRNLAADLLDGRADAAVMAEQAQRHLAEIGRLREALRLARDGWKGLLESDYANRDNPDPWARRVESAVIDRALSSTAPDALTATDGEFWNRVDAGVQARRDERLTTARESGVRAMQEAAIDAMEQTIGDGHDKIEAVRKLDPATVAARPRFEQDAPDHWSAIVSGKTLAVWPSRNGWAWEYDVNEEGEAAQSGHKPTQREAEEAAIQASVAARTYPVATAPLSLLAGKTVGVIACAPDLEAEARERFPSARVIVVREWVPGTWAAAESEEAASGYAWACAPARVGSPFALTTATTLPPDLDAAIAIAERLGARPGASMQPLREALTTARASGARAGLEAAAKIVAASHEIPSLLRGGIAKDIRSLATDPARVAEIAKPPK